MAEGKYIVAIKTKRKPTDTVNSVVVYDFSDLLGGKDEKIFSYDHWRYCMTLSNDPVDLWQIVPVNIRGYHYAMLVDEEGLIHSEPDPMNWIASILAGYGYQIVGDTFLVKPAGEELEFISEEEVRMIVDELGTVFEPVKLSH